MLVSSIRGNSQRLDGGALFGNAPRPMWSRWLAPDELGRVPLACRAMLLEEPGRRVLFETGIGCFFPPELRERYGVVESEPMLLHSLAELGLRDADIDVVVLSHLHFDHAGGLLAPYSADRPPELLFPRAEFVVSSRAFERAEHPHLRDRASFIDTLPSLLRASGRLRLVDDADAAAQLLGTGVRFVFTDGHTPGMLHAEVFGSQASLLFCSDMIPGTAWVHQAITMGYDRFPERLVEEKGEILSARVTERAHLFYTHDPAFAASRVARDPRGRFAPHANIPDFSRWNVNLSVSPAEQPPVSS
jgi:glyoxylase-like metal-dependent hydrolase (beta-lactamase superfamily II)